MGSVFGGPLCDKVGRWRCIHLQNFIFIIGAIVTASAQNIMSLCVGNNLRCILFFCFVKFYNLRKILGWNCICSIRNIGCSVLNGSFPIRISGHFIWSI